MKKISILAAFLFVVLFSSSALAANWVYVATDDSYGIRKYVDKDSIKRGMHSEHISTSNGFSAKIKWSSSKGTEYHLIGFSMEDGEKYWRYIDDIDENGNSLTRGITAYPTDRHIVKGHWIEIWNYVKNNLP